MYKVSEDEDYHDEDVAGRGTVAKRIDILTPKVMCIDDIALSRLFNRAWDKGCWYLAPSEKYISAS